MHDLHVRGAFGHPGGRFRHRGRSHSPPCRQVLFDLIKCSFVHGMLCLARVQVWRSSTGRVMYRARKVSAKLRHA